MPISFMIPKKIRPRTDDGYFEVLAKAIFQVGFNWRIVERKWPDIRRAFHGFRLARVARMDTDEVDRILRDPRIRNGRKVLAIIEDAQRLQRLTAEYGSVRRYVVALRRRPYAERRKRLVRAFRGVGPTAAFVFLYTVSEPVPDWHRRLD